VEPLPVVKGIPVETVRSHVLLSIYADDPVIGEIIPYFLSNLGRYVEDLRTALQKGDEVTACRVCHDLKGTAGGYGYPAISDAALDLETALKRGHSVDTVTSLFEKIDHLCQRAIACLDQSGAMD
jgi:HPt (histidine-containing phosphotransfer) domain-containing protein